MKKIFKDRYILGVGYLAVGSSDCDVALYTDDREDLVKLKYPAWKWRNFAKGKEYKYRLIIEKVKSEASKK